MIESAPYTPSRSLAMFHAFQRSSDKPLKPRAIKRLRQQEALLSSQRRPLQFPQPEPPLWKPLG